MNKMKSVAVLVAKLDSGELVEFDQCCRAGVSPVQIDTLDYVGTGVVYSLDGHLELSRPEYKERCDFYRRKS